MWGSASDVDCIEFIAGEAFTVLLVSRSAKTEGVVEEDSAEAAEGAIATADDIAADGLAEREGTGGIE